MPRATASHRSRPCQFGALIGGSVTASTDDRGQLRFVALPPGLYAIRIELQGFLPYADGDLRIGPGATIETSPVLRMAGQAESIVVEGAGSRIEARNPGFGTLFGEELQQIPARRAGMFDAIRFAPGISPTSPSSGTVTTVSAFGSGTNENQFLFDGTNFTCPCNGIARAEPGTDFIQEVHVQSVGASAEYGNMQGAVDQRDYAPGKRAIPVRRRLLCPDRPPDEPPGGACLHRIRRWRERLPAAAIA